MCSSDLPRGQARGERREVWAWRDSARAPRRVQRGCVACRREFAVDIFATAGILRASRNCKHFRSRRMIRSFAFTTQGRLHSKDIEWFLMPTLLADTNLFLWVDLEKPTPEERKFFLEDLFHFHPLSIEDCVSVSPSPKVEEYAPKDEDKFAPYIFMVIHAVDYSRRDGVFATSELNFFLGKNFLVTYHDVKWYADYTHVQAVRRAIETFTETFEANESYGLASFEMVEVGEEMDDIKEDRNDYCDYRLGVRRDIVFS